MELSRRGMLGGLLVALAAPAIIRPGLLMPIKPRLVVPPGWNVGSGVIISPAELNDRMRAFYDYPSLREVQEGRVQRQRELWREQFVADYPDPDKAHVGV